jgi:hypothetical protein
MRRTSFWSTVLLAFGMAHASAVSEAADGKWAFDPPRDEFRPESLLDLRSLNEKVAGQSGYVTLSKDRNDFVLGDGIPARFWAVNTSYYGENLDRHARFLAKRGVNMVRFHGNITPKEKLDSIDVEERDKLWRTVAAMKKQGFPHETSDGLPGRWRKSQLGAAVLRRAAASRLQKMVGDGVE